MSSPINTTTSIPHPKKRRPDLTRDQRIMIKTLFYHGHWTKNEIANHFKNISREQIKYALAHRDTPQKHRSGRRRKVLMDVDPVPFKLRELTEK